MSRSLYDEAIEAAEELKNATEKKVTQNLIESITPRIKSIIESKIFNEVTKEDLDELDMKEIVEIEEDTDECGMSETDESIEEKLEVTEGAQKTLNKLMTEDYKKSQLLNKINEVKSSTLSLRKAVFMSKKFNKTRENSQKFNYLYKNLLKEMRIIKSYNIFKKDKQIQQEFLELSKELINMSRRQSRARSNQINESFDDLFEMNLFEDDEADNAEEPDDMGSEIENPKGMEDMEDMEDMDDMDDVDDMDSTESSIELGNLSGMSIDDVLQAAADALGESDEGAEEVTEEGAFFESDINDNEDPKESLGELDELDEMYNESYRRSNRVLEIDENMLKREIGRMKSLREGEAKDMASHFGGGSLEGEVFVDGVELNKLHEMKIKAAKVVRKNRMLESKLSQYKNALRGMKGQLVEMNLFNAKLLYANKLMQNRDLTIKHQRHIVESLDEAKTLGEAKILFESLSKSLVTSGRRTGGNITESVSRRRSSASSAVRSAQPINESVALDRWATLAGIKK